MLLLSGVVLFLILGNASARVNCTYGDTDFGDVYCVERYREGSICAEDGFCSNPFRSGCLRKVLNASGVDGDIIPIRTCNTDDEDPQAEEKGECVAGIYKEIRILSQDWEAPMLTAWIMQIILSEVLGVPTTLETSMADASMNFYDPEMRFAYSNDTYNYDALRTSMEYDGCESFRAEQEEKGWYRSCADVVTEAWNGQIENIEAMVQEDVIEPSTGSGGVAKFSWFVPKFTAERNYQLLSIYGLKEGTESEQRRRLAETFLRPRTWKHFCDEVSPDNCTTPYYDDEGRLIASRPPMVGEREEQEFFNAGNYHGHFSKTKDNDCDANPDNCTGHFANPPCVWTNYANAQVHHLGIPVWSDGTSTAGGHYKFWEMVGIYHAANYTKSNVLLYWYSPDTMIQEYIGTDAEFTPIYLPPSTIECRNNRVTEEQRCSDNREDWFGNKAGSCDSENFPVQRLIVANMHNRTYKDAMVDRSPAYKFLKAFRIGDLDLELIYRNWYATQNDRWNYDHREAVCNWVGEHINMLTDFIPESYPRTTVYVEYDSVGLIIALVVAVITVLLVMASAALTYHYRKKRVMMYAQPIFLYLILLGVFSVSIGAILISLPPTSGTCMVTEWFVTIGYSLILVPLIVKVSAINKLFKGAAKMKRVKITTAGLYKKIGYIISGVVVFLIVWSSVDPFKDTKGKRLSGIDNAFGGEIVEVFDTCASNFAVWFILRFMYMVLLCVTATVLAVQTRKVKQEFNESVRLGHMIYAIFLIELILLLIWLLSPKQLNILQQEIAAAIQSYIMSANSLTILFIYFYPKLDAARKNKGERKFSINVSRFSNFKYPSTEYGVFVREKGPECRPNIVSGISIGQEFPQKEDPDGSLEFQQNETDKSKTLKTGCMSNPKSDAFQSTESMPDNAEDETNEIEFSQEEVQKEENHKQVHA